MSKSVHDSGHQTQNSSGNALSAEAMDGLNIEKPSELENYLRETGRVPEDDRLTFCVLNGGVSSRAIVVRCEKGENWVVKQALEQLRVQAEWKCSPGRVRQEARALRELNELLPAGSLPRFVFEDPRHNLLAMSAVGEPHVNWKTLLLEGQVDPRHVATFGRLLGTLHGRSRLKKERLSREFGNRSYFEALRLDAYYRYAADHVPAARDFLLDLVETTRSIREAVVHGDYSPKNVVIFQDELVLLDFEVVHWGDPGFDLGFAMTHFLSKANHLTASRIKFAEAVLSFWESYKDAAGDSGRDPELEARAVRHTLGCLMARVAGKSPLEYLTEEGRERQKKAVLGLVERPPRAVFGLIDGFIGGLG